MISKVKEPVLEDIVEVSRLSWPKKIAKNFSLRHFGVQFGSGLICVTARTGAAWGMFQVTGDGLGTSIVTQLTSGAAYISTYSLALYPLVNRGKYPNYKSAVAGAWQYLSVEQGIALATLFFSMGMQDTYANYFEKYQSKQVAVIGAAALSSFGPQKIPAMILGGGSSNILYAKGVQPIKVIYEKLEAIAAPLAVKYHHLFHI